MDDKKRLPDAELAVMQAIWAVGGEVSRGDLDGHGLLQILQHQRQYPPHSGRADRSGSGCVPHQQALF